MSRAIVRGLTSISLASLEQLHGFPSLSWIKMTAILSIGGRLPRFTFEAISRIASELCVICI
jgi:hypothetical protein